MQPSLIGSGSALSARDKASSSQKVQMLKVPAIPDKPSLQTGHKVWLMGTPAAFIETVLEAKAIEA